MSRSHPNKVPRDRRTYPPAAPDTMTMTLRGGRVLVASDGVTVSYTNFIEGTAFALPIGEFELALVMSRESRRRRDGGADVS